MLMRTSYFHLIRSGRKTTTLRFWKRRQAKPGAIHNIRNLGRLRILTVDETTPEQLTETDAVADGLDGLDELLLALDRYCSGPQRDERTLYRVTFEFLG